MYKMYFLAKADNEADWVYFLFGYLILFPQPAPVCISGVFSFGLTASLVNVVLLLPSHAILCHSQDTG